MNAQVIEPWLVPFRFNAWATQQMLERCRTLSVEQFHRKFDIGPGSAHDTFVHIIGAMARWSDRIAQRPVRDSREKESRQRTIEELLSMLREGAGDLEAVAGDVHANDRYQELIEWPRENTEPYRFTKATALVHVTTHGMYHRAQIRNMLRHLGVDFPEDFDAVEWELVQTGQL